MSEISQELQDKIEAKAFRRLLTHLDNRKDVQNIDLMILADFCRNCVADWYREAAEEQGIDVTKEEARTRVYGIAPDEWKRLYQKPATDEQMAAFNARRSGKA